MAKKSKADNKLELQKLSIPELNKLLRQSQTEWLKLKLELKTGKLKNLHQSRQKRKEIARIKTIIREKELVK